MILSLLVASVLLTAGNDVSTLTVSSETRVIDPAKSLFLRVELKAARAHEAALPDLRDRVQGFSLAEDFEEEPVVAKDGTTTRVANWRLVPEPCADVYKIRPFAVSVDGGRASFVAGPVSFENPPARESVTGGMEAEAKKDLPPLSWTLAGLLALALFAVLALVFAVFLLVRLLARKVKEHRMSPVERAWVELERLLKKGLPGRGRYKDFYVELTMVVRRYVQRKYGIRAPHLTTEEFFAELKASKDQSAEQTEHLRCFLEHADLVKFAGVQATPEMADEATDSARAYIRHDSAPQTANLI